MGQITHGASASKQETSISTPVTTNSGVHFIVGTAPIHTVDGKVNEVILANNYTEAVSQLGYSTNWDNYSICEEIYSAFKLYNVAPVIFVNVLDPSKHKKTIAAINYDITDDQVLLPIEAIKGSVKVTGFVLGTDYDLFYNSENLVLEVLSGSSITVNKIMIGFDEVDPSKVTDDEIIGGFDINTKKTTGFELVDSVFPKFRIVPDLLLCPNWSQKSEIAAIMSAKAENINGIFVGKALIDVDTNEVKYYSDAVAWKKSNNINSPTQILCYPMVKLGSKIYHFSTQAAGLMSKTDNDESLGDGTPCESPSNKLMQIDSAVLKDGTEVLLDLQQVNYLNDNGIITALNFIGGFVLWGNETACFPSNTDVTDYFICVSRMFGWVANSIILTCWSKVDKKLNRRLIDSIVDSLNIWMNGLTSEEKLLGGRVEFKEEENSTVSIMSGKAKFHIYMTPPSPAKKLEFVLEYDVSYLSTLLSA